MKKALRLSSFLSLLPLLSQNTFAFLMCKVTRTLGKFQPDASQRNHFSIFFHFHSSTNVVFFLCALRLAALASTFILSIRAQKMFLNAK
jgi:hypothetical protein